MENESEYRKRIQGLFKRIESAFENVDPDVAECEQNFGALTVTFADQSRCILSAQPSVRQLWLALASKGMAYHFNFDDALGAWVDDKGRGELVLLLKNYFHEVTGLKFDF